ncbi:hypothetical protein B0H14DRAFT_2572424 [Mycena olivaceomarginata]|nr:hypothetical protein B0H14DRAFT_2572424 [Mycena olivaceomarginata]
MTHHGDVLVQPVPQDLHLGIARSDLRISLQCFGHNGTQQSCVFIERLSSIGKTFILSRVPPNLIHHQESQDFQDHGDNHFAKHCTTVLLARVLFGSRVSDSSAGPELLDDVFTYREGSPSVFPCDPWDKHMLPNIWLQLSEPVELGFGPKTEMWSPRGGRSRRFLHLLVLSFASAITTLCRNEYAHYLGRIPCNVRTFTRFGNDDNRISTFTEAYSDGELNYHLSSLVGGANATVRSTGSSLRPLITESEFGSVPQSSFQSLEVQSFDFQGSFWPVYELPETRLGHASARQFSLPDTKWSFVNLSPENSDYQPKHTELVHSSCLSMTRLPYCSTLDAQILPKLVHCGLGLHMDANVLGSFASRAHALKDVYRIAYQRLIILSVPFGPWTSNSCGRAPQSLQASLVSNSSDRAHDSSVRLAMISAAFVYARIVIELTVDLSFSFPGLSLSLPGPFSSRFRRAGFSSKPYSRRFIPRYCILDEMRSIPLTQLAKHFAQPAHVRVHAQSVAEAASVVLSLSLDNGLEHLRYISHTNPSALCLTGILESLTA